MPFPFTQENAASRQRLEALISDLTEDQLRLMSHDGWTIAAFLAHLACWDQRHLHLIRRWKAGGIDESPVDPTAINESIKPLCDWREPDVIRVAPVPLYNTFGDVYRFAEILREEVGR